MKDARAIDAYLEEPGCPPPFTPRSSYARARTRTCDYRSEPEGAHSLRNDDRTQEKRMKIKIKKSDLEWGNHCLPPNITSVLTYAPCHNRSICSRAQREEHSMRRTGLSERAS